MKKCFKCGKLKPLTSFYTLKSGKDGRSGTCRNCARMYDIVKPRKIARADVLRRNKIVDLGIDIVEASEGEPERHELSEFFDRYN